MSYYWVLRVHYMLLIQVFCQLYVLWIFSFSYSLPFHFLEFLSWKADSLNFEEAQLINIFFYGYCFFLFPMFAPRRFIVLIFAWKYIIRFELILYMCEVRVKKLIVLHIEILHNHIPIVLAPFIEKTIIFPLNCLIENQFCFYRIFSWLCITFLWVLFCFFFLIEY